MNDENPFAKHGLTFLKNRLHVWAETVQQNPKLKDKEKESIELARIGLDTAFIDMLEYTKEEKTGRLSELIFQLMLYSVALGKCGPPTEISLLVEQSSIGAKINLKLNKNKEVKNANREMLFISVVNKYIPKIIASGGKLTQDYYIKIWKDVQREIGTPEKEINLLLKNKNLPWPSRSKIRRAIDTPAEVSENKRY